MRRFAGVTLILSLSMVVAMFCACHDPKEPTIVTTSVTETETTKASESSAATTSSEAAASSSESLTGTAETTPQESSESSALTSPSQTPSTTAQKLNNAKGKFNYVLKNKDWKYDGEMYYHKYKDGTVVYYDKETKAYFLIDSKGQGWYYDPELDDFVKDE